MKKYFISGAILILAGVALFFLPADAMGEKNAYLVVGHWWDVFWEVQLPIFLVGTALMVIAFLRKKYLPPEKKKTDHES